MSFVKIISDTSLTGHKSVRVIAVDSGDTIFCNNWNGEYYRDCWTYPNNDMSQQDIYLGHGRYVYKNDEVVGFEYERLYGEACLIKLPFNSVAQDLYNAKHAKNQIN